MADSGDARVAFIGFGVRTYLTSSWPTVDLSVDAVRDIARDLAQAGVGTTMLDDPTTGQLAQLGPALAVAIQAATAEVPNALVVMWAGHAELVGDELRLILHDTVHADDGTKRLFDLALQAARTGARDILLLIDVCYAGAGLVDVLQGFSVAIEQALTTSSAKVWWGVVASAQAWEPARNGRPLGPVM